MESGKSWIHIGVYIVLFTELVAGQMFVSNIDAGSGTIQSPNYPHWYPASQTHVWHIRSPPQTRIQLRVLYFQLEISDGCINDALSVYDGGEANDASLLGRYCGSDPPATTKSASNSLTLHFETNEQLEDQGFVFTYEIVDDAVGSRIVWTEVHPDTDEVRMSTLPADPEALLTPEGTLLPTINTQHYYRLTRGDWRAVATHYGKQQVLWSDPGQKRILKGSIGTNARAGAMFKGTSDSVNGIAVDWMTGNVYWTDATYDWILLFSSDGSRYDIVIDDGLDKPGGIAVHPIIGYLFWTDAGLRPKIERSNLAGGSRIEIATVDVVAPHGITVDYETNLVYWVDADPAGNRVEMSDLDGGSRRQLYFVQTNPGFYDLTIFEEFMYITGRNNRTLDLLRKDTGQHAFTLTLRHEPFGIVTYAPDTQPPAVSHCSSNPCSYLCVGGGPDGYTCLCGSGRLLAPDGMTCMQEREISPPQLFMASRSKLCRFPSNFPDMVIPADYNQSCMLIDRRHAVAIAVDLEDGVMFYSDVVTKAIGMARLQGGSVVQYITGATSSVEGMAVDWSSKVLYWTDNPRGTIEISRYDGSHRTTLLTDNVLRPRSIAIDPQEKVMFWTEFGPPAQIERASLDGTERSVIVESTSDFDIRQPSGLVIDYELKRVYYADAAYGTIISMDYLGGDRKQILVKLGANFFDLALYKDYIMWTELGVNGGIYVGNKETGEGVRFYPQRSEQVYGITMYADTRQVKFHDPCRSNNGGCQQLCLNSKSNTRGFACQCTLGFTLTDDGRTCVSRRLVDNNFILVSDSYQNAIYQVDLDSDSEPSALNLESVKNPIGVTFDPKEEKVYWADVARHEISRMSLNGSNQETIATDNIEQPDGLALDPISRLIYWTDLNKRTISVAKLDGAHRKTLLTNLAKPRAIVLHPVEGIMFWSDWKTNAVIERSYMDGNMRREVVRGGLIWPNGLTIDYRANRLYWCDGGTDKIESSDLAGHDRRIVIDFESAAHTFGIAIIDQFVFWTDWNTRGVSKADKITGSGLISVGPTTYTRPNSLIAVTNNSLPMGINSCVANNGECSTLCLPTAIGRSCACADGMELSEDRVTCAGGIVVECPMEFPYGGVSESCDRSPGSTCTVECYSGHVSTVESVTCLESGVWSIQQNRICEEQQCSPLSLPANAVAGPCYPPYEMGKMCMHECEHGFMKTHGNTRRVCGHDGQWLGTPIVCEVLGMRPCSPDLAFRTTPENVSVAMDDLVQQHCSVNLPHVDITWYKDDTRLVSSGIVDGIFILPSNDLLIPGFSQHHEGHYACVVSYAGQECLRAEVDLYFYDFFDISPSNVTLEEGQHHLFECQAKSALDVITWTKDGEPVTQSEQIIQLAGGSLLLRDIVSRDGGQYTCIVSDQRGTQKSVASAWLAVTSNEVTLSRVNITEICGTVTAPEAIEATTPSSQNPRIVGGQQALRGSAPYMARIWHQTERSFICGATLLNQRWALTAAHCITLYDLTAPDVLLCFGDHDSVNTEDSQVTVEVAEIIKHDEFDADTFDKDVALIRLKQPLSEFTDYIRPICLPPNWLAKELLHTDNLGRVNGWGQIAEAGPYPRYLTEVFLPVVRIKKCKDATTYDVTRNMFCAGFYRDEKDACQGDSGGPYAMQYLDRWYQIGIVSWGEGCAQEGKYGYYTKILRVMPWINSHIEE